MIIRKEMASRTPNTTCMTRHNTQWHSARYAGHKTSLWTTDFCSELQHNLQVLASPGELVCTGCRGGGALAQTLVQEQVPQWSGVEQVLLFLSYQKQNKPEIVRKYHTTTWKRVKVNTLKNAPCYINHVLLFTAVQTIPTGVGDQTPTCLAFFVLCVRFARGGLSLGDWLAQ